MRTYRRCINFLLFFSVFALFARPMWAQITNVTSDQAPPLPGVGHDYVKMLNETVNPANGAVSIRISTPVPGARGFKLPFAFGYDSNAALHLESSTMSDNSGILSKNGWSYVLPALFFQEHEIEYTPQGGGGQSTCYFFNDYVFQDPSGTTHNLGLAVFQPNNTVNCTYLPGQQSEYGPTVLSGGDPWVQAVTPGMGSSFTYPSVTVSDASGTVYYFSNAYAQQAAGGWASLPDWIEDRNGNKISIAGGTSPIVIPDTVGRHAISISGFGTNGNTVTISGLSPYTVDWGTTNFNWTFNAQTASDGGSGTCSSPGAGLYHPSGVPVISSIVLPNGKSYQFLYDLTSGSGLLQKVIYPSGGYVRYVWTTDSLSNSTDFYADSSGNFVCHELYDSIAVQDRYVSFDGSTEPLHQHFTYQTNWVSGNLSPAYKYWSWKQTTVTTYVSGGSYTTVYYYLPVGINPNPADGAYNISNNELKWGSNIARYMPGEATVTYNNSAGSPLLTTTKGWLNQYQLNCALRTLNDSLISGEFYAYGAGGIMTDKKEYDYRQITSASACTNTAAAPSATPIRETLTTPQTFAKTPIYTSAASILDLPASIVTNANGSRAAETDFSYDQTSVASVSNLPSGTHDETDYAASYNNRGNLTTETVQCLQSCSNDVTKHTFDETGQVVSTTDSANYTTNYSHTDNYDSPPTSNTNTYLTQITDPLGHISKFKYAYADGQLIQSQDQNDINASRSGTTYAYNDSLRRLTQTVLPDGETTNVSYNDASPAPSVTTSTLVNPGTNQYVTRVTTLDGVGHPHIQQTRQASGSANYDSVETDYDGLGRPDRVTMPYVGTLSQTNTSGPATATSYDSLSRTLIVQDAAGGYTSHSYTGNDDYVTEGPAPSGENTKRRQLEYDALGRLTSVCEVTAVNGIGTCSQTSSQTGYWTKYAYDGNSNLYTVTQNAQSSTQQIRTYNHDSLSRLTSEVNPETNNASTTYQYDTVPSNCYNYGDNQTGNLTAKTDANGNTNCFHYDALHRLIDVGSTGSIKNYDKRFRYDSSANGVVSPPTGSSFGNTVGRLVEAETDCCVWPPDTITDEWFSYGPSGRTTNLWEHTPNSGTGYYYPIVASYYPNATLNQISGLPGVPAVTYGLDGEGRISTVSMPSPNQNPVTATSFNAASQVTQMTFGSSDSDTYTYDPNTGRMTQYQFNVNGQSETGVLTWNADATLGKLAITDPFNGYDSQTCNYTHDDMTRIGSASCTSTPSFSQTFSYDPFGNVSAAGTASFQPTYSSSTNRITQIGSTTPSYDNDGNVLSDSMHTFTWDVYGLPASIDGITTTYDALGRVVERDTNGTITQVAYTPGGTKLGIMLGQTLNGAYIPMPNGTVLHYTGSGAPLYRHADWQGSVRLVTTSTRTVYDDSAFGPFGYAYIGGYDGFTGMNMDTSYTLYDFPARELEWQGRWPSPDPSGLDSADSDNPQSWNRYAYVLNNPLNATDPDGLDYWLIGGNQCGQNNVQCDKEGFVLDNNGNRVAITDQQLSGSNGLAKFDENGDLIFTTSQGTFQGQFFDPNPVPPSAIVTADYHDMLFDALVRGTQMAQPGVTAAVTITAPQYLFMAGATIALSGAGSTLTTTPGEAGEVARAAAQSGRAGVQKTLRSALKRLAKHQADLERYKAQGGYTSHTEGEIRHFQALIRAAQDWLLRNP